MKINTTNTTNTTNKNKKRVAITTIMCAMIIFALVIVGCGIKKNSTVAEAEADVIATVGTTIDTTETVEETTETIVEETTETTETVEEPSEEPSVETPSENKPSTTETEKPSETPSTTPSVPTTTETPSTPSTTETPSQPTTSEPTTTETPTTEEPTPNVEKHWCGTPMQMMSGYIFHPAEGYYAQAIRFSNGEIFAPFNGDYNWVDEYMHNNGILSFSVADNYFIETTPEWREENVTQMCCPSCRTNANNFYAY